MRKTDIRYQTYLKILEEELLPAMGCTEPIAVAYAAAMARDLLGSMPGADGGQCQRKYPEKRQKCGGAQYRRASGIQAAAAAWRGGWDRRAGAGGHRPGHFGAGGGDPHFPGALSHPGGAGRHIPDLLY